MIKFHQCSLERSHAVLIEINSELKYIKIKWIIKSHQYSLERSHAVLIEINSEF